MNQGDHDFHIVKKKYADLTRDELFDILKFRSEIFNLELGLPLQTTDEHDPVATHILLVNSFGELLGYVRCVPRLDKTVNNSSFSYLCVAPKHRQGNSKNDYSFGLLLTNEAIKACREISPNFGIVTHTNIALKKWFEKLGFTTVGEGHSFGGVEFIWLSLNPRAEKSIEAIPEAKTSNRTSPKKIEIESALSI